MDFLTNTNVLFYLMAYLIGAIPFGLVLAKMFAKVDITSEGSKSIGATNVLRVVSEKDPKLAKKLGAGTLVLDALKGMIILAVAKMAGIDESVLWGMAVLAVLGHCYSPYLMFEGGKGVATSFGVLLFMLPIETILAFVSWAFMAKSVKISSLSSLVGLLILLISMNVIHPTLPEINSQVPVYLIAFIIVYKHIPNIIRLIKKEEQKVAL
ncbi:MAG: glycerol-3-phosphate 1-O-acyltransferase PlsY [Campylobacterales bacterium]|nr:glycerol-3-phosphate 1-O-acyltransferase PlsY [Campylobacterales bacterium]